jgi:hypothetical protein
MAVPWSPLDKEVPHEKNKIAYNAACGSDDIRSSAFRMR